MDASSICPGEEDTQNTIRQFGPLVEVIGKHKKAIGHAGIGPEDIDAELGREMTKVMTGLESPEPHRFDINDLPAGREAEELQQFAGGRPQGPGL